MDIGQKIKTARLSKGLTQQELGELLGVQKSAIAKYENGKVVNIKRSTLKKISNILEIRPSELIDEQIEADPIGTAEKHADAVMDVEFMEMHEDFKKLNAQNRRIVRDLVHNLANGGSRAPE